MNKQEFMAHISEYWGELGYIEEIKHGLVANTWFMTELRAVGKLCRRHHKLCENLCNVPNFKPKLITKQEQKIGNKLNELSLWLYESLKVSDKLFVEFQQDPRGLTAKVNIKGVGEEVGRPLYWVLQ